MTLLKFFFCYLLLFPILLLAQDIQTIDKEIILNTDQLKVARSKALEEIAIQLSREVIGEKRYLKEQKKINQFIIPSKNRYILSSQLSPPVLTETGAFSWKVKAKVSKENLQKLLLEHDLFYSSKGSSCLLPLVYFIHYPVEETEKVVTRSWLWWKQPKEEGGNDPLLRHTAEVFFHLLEEKLIPKGFYSLNPTFQKISKAFPFNLNKEKKLILKDFKPLAEFYNCDIALSGYVQWGGAEIEQIASSHKNTNEGGEEESASKNNQFGKVFLKLSNIKTGRFFFHLKRSFLFSTEGSTEGSKKSLTGDSTEDSTKGLTGGSTEDSTKGLTGGSTEGSTKGLTGGLKKEIPLSARSQLADILNEMGKQLVLYQKNGSLDLKQMIISVQGPLSYSQKEILKLALIEEISGIKSLTQRWISSSRVVYSAEISESAKAVTKQLREIKLPGFAIQFKGYKKGQAEIYAKQQ